MGNTQCFQLYKKLNEDYPETAEVAQELRAKIEKFSKNLPLIKCFTSEAMIPEDWDEISKLIGPLGNPFDFPNDIKVQHFIENDLYRYIEEIEEITMKAEKKHSLSLRLNAMKYDMKQF